METITTTALPFQAGEATQHRGITVAPLFPTSDPVCAYVSLARASAEGLVVTELDDMGSVGAIRVSNPTPHNVLLYDGEEVTGAKQDRILNVSVLVAAGSNATVPVSCIEAGRWHHQTDAFRPAHRTPATTVRRAKAERLMAAPMEPGAAQSAVWDAVSLKEQQHAMHSGTSRHGDLIEHEAPRLDELRPHFALQPGQCGMVMGVSGQVVCMDAVSRPDVYAHLHDALLTGYLLDALPALDGDAPGADAVEAFMGTVAAGERMHRPGVAMGNDVRISGKGVMGSGLLMGEELIQMTAFARQDDGGLHDTERVVHASRIARPGRRRH